MSLVTMGAATTNVKWYRSPLFPLVIASGNSAATDDRGQDMTLTFYTEQEAQTFLDIWGHVTDIIFNARTALFTVEV